MTTRNNLEFVQEAIMAMYDYIDGGVPSPYPTPEEWRRQLNANALRAVAILRQRIRAEAFMPDEPAGTTAAAPAKATPAVAPAAVAPNSAKPPSSDQSDADAAAEADSRAARKEQERLAKRKALKSVLSRLKEKDE